VLEGEENSICDDREEGSRKFPIYYSTKLTAQNKIIFSATKLFIFRVEG
jgi:hypothetical protein